MAKNLRDLGKELQTVLEQSVKTFKAAQIKDEFINALWSCQSLEFMTKVLLNLTIQEIKSNLKNDFMKYEPRQYKRLTLEKLIERLGTFYPRDENKELIDSLKDAQGKRNKFIHGVFNIKTTDKGEFKILNFSISPEQHPQSIKIMKAWLLSYKKALKMLQDYNRKLPNYRIKLSEIIE